MSGFKTSYVTHVDDAPTSVRKEPLGTIRFEGNKVYKYVQWKLVPTEDVDGVAGDAVCYTDYSAHEIGIDLGDMEASLPAGIVVAAIDMSAEKGYYSWIQIGGPATVSETVAASAAAGQMINLGSASAADKTFTLWISTDEFACAGILIHAANKEVLLACPW